MAAQRGEQLLQAGRRACLRCCSGTLAPHPTCCGSHLLPPDPAAPLPPCSDALALAELLRANGYTGFSLWRTISMLPEQEEGVSDAEDEDEEPVQFRCAAAPPARLANCQAPWRAAP